MLPDIYAPGVPHGLILGKLDGHISRNALKARYRAPRGPTLKPLAGSECDSTPIPFTLSPTLLKV